MRIRIALNPDPTITFTTAQGVVVQCPVEIIDGTEANVFEVDVPTLFRVDLEVGELVSVTTVGDDQ